MLLGDWGSVSSVVVEPAPSPLPSTVLGPHSLESFLSDSSPLGPTPSDFAKPGDGDKRHRENNHPQTIT